MKYASIEDIERILQEATGKSWLEASQAGLSYRVQLDTLVRYIQSKLNTDQQQTTPYWSTLPAYTIDDINNSISIDSAGRYTVSGTTSAALGRILSFSSIADANIKRFDAVVYSLVNKRYEIIVGEQSENPALPSYNEKSQLLLTYIYIDSTGAQTQPTANEHVQNTDQYLDFGGVNEISAKQIIAKNTEQDTRLTTHDSDIGALQIGKADLDISGKLLESQLPALALIDNIDSLQTSLADYIALEWTDGSIQKGDTVSLTNADNAIEVWRLKEGNGSLESHYQKIDVSKIDWTNVLNKPLFKALALLDQAGTAQIVDGAVTQAKLATALLDYLWHKDNDGAGSGLDADLLDGKHAKDFISETALYAGGLIDPNTTTDNYILTSQANAPGAGFWFIRTFFDNTKSSYRSQLAIKYENGDDMYIRQFDGISWTSWKKIWHQGNFDPSSIVTDKELHLIFDADLDTVSPEMTFKGAITVKEVVLSSKLSGLSYQVKLDTATSYTSLATITDLQNWINSNVTASTARWQLKAVASYAASQYGEASATLIYR